MNGVSEETDIRTTFMLPGEESFLRGQVKGIKVMIPTKWTRPW